MIWMPLQPLGEEGKGEGVPGGFQLLFFRPVYRAAGGLVVVCIQGLGEGGGGVHGWWVVLQCLYYYRL